MENKTKMNNKMKAMLASYARSFLSAALAVYATVGLDPEAMAYAGLAAILPVALRAINKKDPAFGFVAAAVAKEVEKKAEESVAKAKVKKKAASAKAKKAPKKK